MGLEPTPRLIFHNGTICTQDNAVPMVSALAVSGQTIAAAGRNRDILPMAGPQTRIIDLNGRLMLPGFWDTHFHFFSWAVNIDSLELARARSFTQMAEMVRSRAHEVPAGTWITGQGFNETEWPENRMPDRRDLDRLAPDHPVCIWRCDCHLAVANSRALALAGIDEEFVPPEGAVIDRDGTGVPTGILKELAPNLISDRIPAPSDSRLTANLDTAVSRCHRMGLTGVHDVRLMGGVDAGDAFKSLQLFHGRGKLKLRCFVDLAGEKVDQAIDLGLTSGFGDDILRIGWVKFFADGGMGARTAWMDEPYLDGGTGMPLTPPGVLEEKIRRADRAGLACMVHSLGDRACRETVGIFRRMEAEQPARCRLPHRMEHLQLIRPETVAELGELKNMVISCQPNNLSLDISMIEQSVGPLGRYAYSFKRLMDTGLPTVFNSDAPVSDPNPLCGIYSAVTRQRMDGTPAGGWYPEQAVSVAEAVRAYTLAPARISGMENMAGSLVPGKRADLVILDKNIFDIPPEEIPDTRVDMTLFDGEIVYE